MAGTGWGGGGGVIMVTDEVNYFPVVHPSHKAIMLLLACSTVRECNIWSINK